MNLIIMRFVKFEKFDKSQWFSNSYFKSPGALGLYSIPKSYRQTIIKVSLNNGLK